MIIAAEMPSNIALIKYMGKLKSPADRNRPTNASLSYTLPHLRTRVELTPTTGTHDNWSPLEQPGWLPVALSERGRQRYLSHFDLLKQRLGIQGHFLVRSANNFPADCGIASSASSFAALTMASYQLALEQSSSVDLSIEDVAELSRMGSGSSLRSFTTPFALWDDQGLSPVEVSYSDLIHQVVIVDQSKKAISSSEAHEHVPTSLLFEGRPQRAEARLVELLQALKEHDWVTAFQVVWAEFWDMHALFATARPTFRYMTSGSLKVLDYAYNYWEEHNDGPLVTMDAGANVHFLFRPEQKDLASIVASQMRESFLVLGSLDSATGESK